MWMKQLTWTLSWCLAWLALTYPKRLMWIAATPYLYRHSLPSGKIYPRLYPFHVAQYSPAFIHYHVVQYSPAFIHYHVVQYSPAFIHYHVVQYSPAFIHYHVVQYSPAYIHSTWHNKAPPLSNDRQFAIASGNALSYVSASNIPTRGKYLLIEVALKITNDESKDNIITKIDNKIKVQKWK